MSGAGRSTITITFPASATSTIGFTAVTDVNSGQQVGSCSASSTTIEVCGINSGKSIAAGAPVKIDLDGVTNTTTVSSSNLLNVSTTSDTSTARTTFATVAAAAVTGLSVDNTSPTTAAGGRTEYLITFTTSATGGGMSGAGRSTITITFPASATSTIGFTAVTDVNSGQQVGSCSASSTTIEVCGINSGKSIAAGAPVKIDLDGVTNTTTVPGANLLTVSTTSDTATARATYATVAAAAVTGLSVDNTSPTTA